MANIIFVGNYLTRLLSLAVLLVLLAPLTSIGELCIAALVLHLLQVLGFCS